MKFDLETLDKEGGMMIFFKKTEEQENIQQQNRRMYGVDCVYGNPNSCG
jgi:hypothetical protein